jgi:uncharacterized membrane protein YhiD involved in acid resistance
MNILKIFLSNLSAIFRFALYLCFALFSLFMLCIGTLIGAGFLLIGVFHFFFRRGKVTTFRKNGSYTSASKKSGQFFYAMNRTKNFSEETTTDIVDVLAREIRTTSQQIDTSEKKREHSPQ